MSTAKIQTVFQGKGDYRFYRVSFDQLTLREGHNPRNWWDSSKAIPIDDLVGYIEAVGVETAIANFPPIEVVIEDDALYIVAGERRYRALKAVRNTGVDIPVLTVKLLDPKTPPDALFASAVAENEGLKLDQIEEAFAYKRLRDDFAWDVKAIAGRFGKSLTHVYGRLALVDTNGVAEAVQAGTIGVKDGEEVARKVKAGTEPEKAIAQVATQKKDGRKTRYSEPKTVHTELLDLLLTYGPDDVKKALRNLYIEGEPCPCCGHRESSLD